MDPKVRDRTSAELFVRKKEFLKICEILDELKVNYFLQSGILLGAIRDNDLIKWDWDIEISVFSDEFLSKIDLIVDKLKKNQFKIIKVNKKKDDSKIDFIGEYPENVTGYTIWSWNYSSIRDVYWRREFSLPSKFLTSFSKIDFLGRQFNCPININEYLTFVYGDWKKPLRTSNKKVYLTKNYKKKTIFLTIYIEKFLMKIYSYAIMIKKLLKF